MSTEDKKDINLGGAPTKYKEEYNEQVYKLCLMGASDKVIADFFNVSESTINTWKIEHPMFLESLKNGKIVADMGVAQSLYKSAHDRMIPTQKAHKVKKVYYTDDGKRIEEEKIEIVTEMMGVPANDRSIKYWLNNRRPKEWRETKDINHVVENKGASDFLLEE